MRRRCAIIRAQACARDAAAMPAALSSSSVPTSTLRCALGARMKIIVTVKQVPDPDIPPTHFKVDEAARKVVPPSGVAPVMNGYDGNALEAALRLKEKHGGTVTVLTIGGAEGRGTPKRAVAMGGDSAGPVQHPPPVGRRTGATP